MPKTKQLTVRSLRRQIDRLRALHRMGVALSSTMNPNEIMDVLIKEVARVTHADTATIFLRDEQAQKMVPQMCTECSTQLEPLDLLASDDLVVEVAHTGKHRQAELRQKGAAPSPRDICRLAMPLIAGDEVLGVVDLHAARVVCFDQDNISFLSTLCSQAAQVMRNASTHAELEQHYREVSLLYEIQQEIASTLNYQSVLTLIVERTKRLLSASECTIRLLVDRSGKRFIRIAATTGRQFIGPEEVPFEESHVDHQVVGGKMIYIEDVRRDARFRWREEAERAGVVSMVCVPLVFGRQIIGTIRVYTSERRDFSVSERKMLLAIAGQAAAAIENARLYRQIESKNRELTSSYERLRRTQTELVRKERLAALGEMAATVAHEIRNPLTSVRGFAQRLYRRHTEHDEKLASYASIIVEEVDRLNKFIAEVLDFARRTKPSFEKADVNHVLSDIVELMREELAGSDIVLIADLDMNLRPTVVDVGLTKQMLLNLLQNARQAVHKHGIITIKTQNMGAYIRVRLVDNGSGIPRDLLGKIWSPFFTTKTQGTGLGLAFVQRTINDHHGDIFIRSRPGCGTIVDIRLPIIESEDAFFEMVT